MNETGLVIPRRRGSYFYAASSRLPSGSVDAD